MKEYSFLPDMSAFPDCEEKRQIENLAQKLELQLSKMTPENGINEIEVLHKEANELWWEMNTCMGALVTRTVKEAKQNKRWLLSLSLSVIAIILSIISIIIRVAT